MTYLAIGIALGFASGVMHALRARREKAAREAERKQRAAKRARQGDRESTAR